MIAWLLAALLLIAPDSVAVESQALIAPSAIAYMGNAGGREVPVYWKPRFRKYELPMGHFPDGTRVEIISGLVIADGQRWVKVRFRGGFEAWALTRTLKPNPPFQEGANAHRPDLRSGKKWVGEIQFCFNPAGLPRTFSEGQVVDAINRATTLWDGAAGGRIPFVYKGTCRADPRKNADGVTVIGWGSPKDSITKQSVFGMSHRRTSGNQIVESDIELHGGLLGRGIVSPAWLTERSPSSCLSQTMLHEVGHLIGLKHAEESVVSVMQPTGVCIRLTELPAADAHNARLLYP